MIQRKKKKIINISIIAVIVAVILLCGMLIIQHRKNLDLNNIENNVGEQFDFSSKTLVVKTDEELEKTYNASSKSKMWGGDYVLKYTTEEDAKNAYENLKKDEKIKEVTISLKLTTQSDIVAPMTIPQTIGTDELENWGTYTMGLNETQDIINAKTTKDEIVVAVIDSGFDLTESILDEQNLRGRIDSRYINITNS